MEPIARIHTDFSTKFGVPRQSGLVEALEAEIIFEPPYRDPAALRGLEGFSHLWPPPAGGQPADGGFFHPFPLPA